MEKLDTEVLRNTMTVSMELDNEKQETVYTGTISLNVVLTEPLDKQDEDLHNIEMRMRNELVHYVFGDVVDQLGSIIDSIVDTDTVHTARVVTALLALQNRYM